MVEKRKMPKEKGKNDTFSGIAIQPNEKNNISKFMQRQTVIKEGKNEMTEGEKKNSSKQISAHQMAKRKERGIRRLQAFQNKKRVKELAMGMVARNEVLDQLGLTIEEDEIISERAARDLAETLSRPSSPIPFSSGYPSRSPSPESLAILKQEERRRWEEERLLHVKESPRLVGQNRAQREKELANSSKARDHLRERRAKAILAGSLRAR